MEQARALLETVAKRRAQDHPEANRKWTIEGKPARTLFVGPTLERTLWSLQAVVLMLLLISCANVGTLLASQVAARRTEFSVRMAREGPIEGIPEALAVMRLRNARGDPTTSRSQTPTSGRSCPTRAASTAPRTTCPGLGGC